MVVYESANCDMKKSSLFRQRNNDSSRAGYQSRDSNFRLPKQIAAVYLVTRKTVRICTSHSVVKILWKMGETAPLIHNNLLPDVRFLRLKKDKIFLYEISGYSR